MDVFTITVTSKIYFYNMSNINYYKYVDIEHISHRKGLIITLSCYVRERERTWSGCFYHCGQRHDYYAGLFPSFINHFYQNKNSLKSVLYFRCESGIRISASKLTLPCSWLSWSILRAGFPSLHIDLFSLIRLNIYRRRIAHSFQRQPSRKRKSRVLKNPNKVLPESQAASQFLSNA